MRKEYEETKLFWDKVFSEKEFNPINIKNGFNIKEIDESLEWLCENKGTVLDFGCGNGSLLFRTMFLGVDHGIGCDLSDISITTAKESVKIFLFAEKMDLISGDLEALKNKTNHFFDGCILSNIIDNMLPEDTKELVAFLKERMNPGGRLFIKLNDLIGEQEMLQYGAKQIGEGLFKESSGLFLKNITEKDIQDLFADTFSIAGKTNVTLFDQINRIFLLEKKYEEKVIF